MREQLARRCCISKRNSERKGEKIGKGHCHVLLTVAVLWQLEATVYALLEPSSQVTDPLPPTLMNLYSITVPGGKETVANLRPS